MGPHWDAYLACYKGQVNHDLLPYLRSIALEEIGKEAREAAEQNFPEITKQVKEFYKMVVARKGAFDE